MVISVKHPYVSTKPDGSDPTLVNKTHWNAEHEITMAAARLVGRSAASAGAAEEISFDPTTLLLTGTVLGVNPAAIPAGSGVPSSRKIIAGDGLAGGGDLSANRTISMAYPVTLTATTTNSAFAGGHTHAMDIANIVAAGMGSTISSYGYLGTYAMCQQQVAVDASLKLPGETIAGSALKYCSALGAIYSAVLPAGTWRCQGRVSSNLNGGNVTLWLRVA